MNGFEGHCNGHQLCRARLHAVPCRGKISAELILGLTPTLDLSIFSRQRILDNQAAFESEHKLV
jgi:hypothetical protein